MSYPNSKIIKFWASNLKIGSHSSRLLAIALALAAILSGIATVIALTGSQDSDIAPHTVVNLLYLDGILMLLLSGIISKRVYRIW